MMFGRGRRRGTFGSGRRGEQSIVRLWPRQGGQRCGGRVGAQPQEQAGSGKIRGAEGQRQQGRAPTHGFIPKARHQKTSQKHTRGSHTQTKGFTHTHTYTHKALAGLAYSPRQRETNAATNGSRTCTLGSVAAARSACSCCSLAKRRSGMSGRGGAGAGAPPLVAIRAERGSWPAWRQGGREGGQNGERRWVGRFAVTVAEGKYSLCMWMGHRNCHCQAAATAAGLQYLKQRRIGCGGPGGSAGVGCGGPAAQAGKAERTRRCREGRAR
jgi:hypothetical protein